MVLTREGCVHGSSFGEPGVRECLFFFQAEDGIRDDLVTGVQTCALPILTGTVEQLSVRTIWLRGGDGTMHVIPFNAVTTISNSSRGLGNASVSVTVAFQEDSDRVAAVLREIAAEMRHDPDLAPLMLGDLKELGVDAVKATGVTIAGEIPCTASGRWAVQREFNRRLQKRFQDLGIALSSG